MDSTEQKASEARQRHVAEAKARAEKVDAFNILLTQVTFEHREAYKILVQEHFHNIYLRITRDLICTTTNKPTAINNSVMLRGDVTEDQFVKALFRAIGQFEAHEFVESFRVKGRHAYFPHDTKELVEASMFRGGERLNQRLLSVWRDVENNRDDFDIAMRYLQLWIVTVPVISHWIAFERYAKAKVNLWTYISKQFVMRTKTRFTKLMCRFDMAWQAFKQDPMDIPVMGQPFVVTITLNTETGEVKKDDSQNGTKD